MSEQYRRYAAECLQIAQSLTHSQQKTWLLEMAQRWVHLARQVEKNGTSASEQLEALKMISGHAPQGGLNSPAFERALGSAFHPDRISPARPIAEVRRQLETDVR
jgi:hypothetical protein